MSSAPTLPAAASRFRLGDMQRTMSERAPMRAHTFVMALLFLAAIGVGYALLPGESERIAMLERDGKIKEARHILEAGFNSGDRRQRTLFQLQGLYESAGDLAGTRRVLELLAQQRPRDAAIQRQLGLFYKQTQDEPAYVQALLKQIDLRYSETACKEVIGILRRKGAYGEEQAVLQKCRQKGYRKPEDMIRLASLLAADGDIREATLLLRGADDLRRLKSDRDRLQLFQLLIDIDQPGEAQRRAVRWVRAATVKDDQFALTLVSALVAANRHDFAIELARDTSVPGDSVFLSIAEVMIERNEMVAAQSILRGWLAKVETLNEDVIQRFIVAALSANAPDIALSGAQKAGLAKLTADSVFELARGLDAAGNKLDADALRARARQMARGAEPPAPAARTNVRILRGGQPTRVANLDQWKTALWQRLAEENKAASQGGAPQPLAKPGKSSKDLTALKRSRKARAYQRTLARNKLKAGAPAALPFSLTPNLP